MPEHSLEQLRLELLEATRSGTKRIRVEALLRWIDDQGAKPPGPDEFDLAYYNARNESTLAEWRADVDSALEMFRTTIQAGQTAIRSALLVTGGAAAAMLAFIGNVWESPTSRPVVAALANALLDFSFGFLASAVAAGLTYCTQFMYSSDRNRVGRALNLAAVGTVLFAYALFVSGSLSAYSAIEQHLAPAELAER